MNLIINSKLVIPMKEIKWRFSRSSGSGGQNVNKIDSRVEIIFDVYKSKALTSYQKSRISNHDEMRLVNGCICLAVQDKRTQYQNRQLAVSRLTSVLRYLLKPPSKQRKVTIPTRSSQRKRVDLKKRRGELKRNRQLKIDYF